MDQHDELVAALRESGMLMTPPPAAEEIPAEREVSDQDLAEIAAEIETATPVEAEAAAAQESVEDVSEEMIEEVAQDLERREEIYGEQVAGDVAMEASADERKAVAAALEAGTLAQPKAAGRREARFAPGAAGAYVAGVIGDAEIEAKVNDLPKKVKEKAANLVDHIKKGRTLSVFTQAAVNIMNVEGAISNERLVKAFTTEATKRGMSAGYSIGTARSQAGQQIALFTRLGIGLPNAGKVVPNDESPLWKALARPQEA